MKKIINIFKKEYIIIAILVIISLFPLYMPGFLYTHDGIIHLYRTVGAYENIKNFDIFNRISFNMINGDGYGWGIFYPPLSAVVPAIFMCFGLSLFTAQKLFLVLFSILAGIFSYKLFKELFKDNFVSLCCSVLYILAPYKINQIIIRGAMGEVALFTFLPLVVLGIIKILKKDYKYKYYFIFGACGIVYSHTISTIYTAIFGCLLIILGFLLKRYNLFNKKTIWEFIKAICIILLISLPILVPMLQHKTLDIYKISDTTADVANRVVHPGQLIGGSIESSDVGDTEYYSDEKEMNYMIGLTSIIILTLIPFFYKSIKEKGEIKDIVLWGTLLLISIIMMVIPNIWNKIEILDVIQYPWRLLNFAVLFITILSGYVLKEILQVDNKYSILLFIIAFSMIFVFMIGSKARFAKSLQNDFDFYDQCLDENDDFGSIAFAIGYGHEYLPKVTSTNDLIEKGSNIDILHGDAKISNISNNKNVLRFDLENLSDNTVIELPRVYYLGYNVTINNECVDYTMSEKGFVQVNIKGTQTCNIEVKYLGTKLYKVIDVTAIITLILYTVYIVALKDLKFKRKI